MKRRPLRGALEKGHAALVGEEARRRANVAPDGGEVDVADAVLLAEAAHNGRDGSVVAVAEPREEVVLNLHGPGGRGETGG